MNRLVGILWAASMLVSLPARATDYEIDPTHSHVGFSVKHLVVSTVRGELGKVTGAVQYDAKKPRATTLEATVELASLSTQEPKRDAHLKSPDFFDVEKFPNATFKSKKVEAAGKGRLKISGDLTLHGVTKPVTLLVTGPSQEVKTPFGTTVVAASGTAVLQRKDFGLTWNKTMDNGGVVVGDEVSLTIDVELVKKETEVSKAAQ